MVPESSYDYSEDKEDRRLGDDPEDGGPTDTWRNFAVAAVIKPLTNARMTNPMSVVTATAAPWRIMRASLVLDLPRSLRTRAGRCQCWVRCQQVRAAYEQVAVPNRPPGEAKRGNAGE